MPKTLDPITRRVTPKRSCVRFDTIIPVDGSKPYVVAYFEWHDVDADGNMFNVRDGGRVHITGDELESDFPTALLPDYPTMFSGLSAYLHSKKDAAEAAEAESDESSQSSQSSQS